MSEEILKQIELNTRPKSSYQLLLSSNQTRFTTRFSPALELKKNKEYKIALVNLETYYSFPNIKSTNNKFKYSHDSGTTWTEIVIPVGSYEITDLNATVQRMMKQNGHYNSTNDTYNATIGANVNTLRSTLTLGTGYQVDFSGENTLRTVLGFNAAVYSASFQESENVVNIISVSSLFLNIDLIGGSYLNGTVKNTIYSFYPNVSPGFKIVETPRNLVYLPLIKDTIHSIDTELTDQNGDLIDLRGETLTVRFHIIES